MTTLADKAILSGADNHLPMLEKDMYDLWKSRMELYMMNRQHGRMIFESVENGQLLWPTFKENGVTRPKKYLNYLQRKQSKLTVISRQLISFSKDSHQRSMHPYTSGPSGNNSGKQRIVVCYNYKGEGHMSKQRTKPKRKMDEAWFKDKIALMVNLSHSGSDNLAEKEESRNIDRELALEKHVKELNNIVFKRNQSAQTVHMLTKPQFFYDHTTRQALGFQNPCYLKKAQQLEPKLYDGSII
nr:hypothetical protein [Tanacetum cinerariifolium]